AADDGDEDPRSGQAPPAVSSYPGAAATYPDRIARGRPPPPAREMTGFVCPPPATSTPRASEVHEVVVVRRHRAKHSDRLRGIVRQLRHASLLDGRERHQRRLPGRQALRRNPN